MFANDELNRDSPISSRL